jgi:uncharacterized protein (TIGR02680 family)
MTVLEDLGTRWKPTRAGILNVWRYHDETLQFHNGRLLLRGPNGTGKSKALEVLLPFLFDASLRPNRLSTFGGSERTMYWNLMGENYPHTTRVGYVWLEFGRLAGESEDYFTCGARLQASRNSRNVSATYFTTTARIDLDGGVALLSPDGRPLTRGDLATALAGTGEVFDGGADYKRSVRATLFPRFTPDQYEALITALLQLRTPKLSEHLNPAELSELLSAALPAIDQQDVAEIAEGFEKLDRRREELARLETEVAASATLARHARGYARRVLRSGSARLTEAGLEMERAARDAKASRDEHESVSAEMTGVRSGQEHGEADQRETQARLDGLRASDLYKQGQQLDELRTQVRTAAAEAGRTAERSARAAGRALEDEESRGRAQAAHATAATTAERGQAQAAQAAVAVGLDSLPGRMAGADARTARQLLLATVSARAEQVGEVRAAIAVREQQNSALAGARARLEQRRDAHQGALEQLERATAGEREELGRLRQAIERWAAGTVELALAEAAAALADAAGTETEVLSLVNGAAAERTEDYGRAQAELDARRAAAGDERAVLAAERDRLAAREVVVPPAPPTRTAGRDGRAGAPLWRCVDWAAGAAEADQGRIEGALQAAGLLDAWVSPDGGLSIAGHDTFAAPDIPAGRPLTQVLVPDSAAPGGELAVPPQRVAALLSSIAYCDSDAAGSAHPSAIGADGSWKLGAAHGSYAKETAQYLGATARERARLARIAELDQLIAGCDAALAAVSAAQDAVARHRTALAAELSARPAHDAYAAAVRAVHDTESLLAARADQLAEGQRDQDAAEAAARAAAHALTELAARHRLPERAEPLAALVRALEAARAYGEEYLAARAALNSAAAVLAAADTAAQRSRDDATAAAADARARRHQADELDVRLATVERTIGAEYRQILDEVSGCRARLDQLADEIARARDQVTALAGRLGELRSAMAADAERSQLAVAARDAAAGHLRHIVDLGFPADAALITVVGDSLATVTAIQALARGIADELAEERCAPEDLRRAEARLAEGLHGTRQALGGRADLDLTADGDLQVFSAAVDGVRLGAAALHRMLDGEFAAARRSLTDDEYQLFDRTLTGDTRRQVAERIRLAEELVGQMNEQLQRVRTASGLRIKLDWRLHEDLPASHREARALLLRDPATLSADDKTALHAFFRSRIEEVRDEDEGSGWEAQLLQVLDYRKWHEFTVAMDKGDAAGWVQVTKRRHGALSGGEKAISLHLPLFAAAAAHYGAAPGCPRLILLDEVFVGVDEGNRGQLLDLLVTLDLDLVLTSDHEWCTYTELNGIAIHQLLAEPGEEGDDAVTTVRFVWDGNRTTETELPVPVRPRPEPRDDPRDDQFTLDYA